MEDYQYTAFISYRHTSKDEAIARKLHTLIENYHIPDTVSKKTGKKKMGRVFRDKEELPLSNDLGADIYKALDNSQWLIVICSPAYPESKWCLAELDYFISNGRRDHILALLVEGEPQDAFPEQLTHLYDEEGNLIKIIEPLAGDVRGETVADSLKLLNVEYLRMLAPMLGVNFDELRQRARQRRIRIISASLAASFILLSSFLVYAIVKNRQIADQRNIAMDNQMQLLIEQANISTGSGNKLLAIEELLQAGEIRKTVGSKNDVSYSAALEYALYNTPFESVLTINSNNRQFDELVFSYNDDYLLGITNLNSACLIDAHTGNIIHTVSRSEIGQLDCVGFTGDDKYFYMVDSWYGFVSVYEVSSGKLYKEYDASDGYAWNIGEKVFPMEGDKLLIIKDGEMVVWDFVNDQSESILPCGTGVFEGYIRPLIVDLAPDEKSVVIGSHGYGAGMYIITLDGERKVSLEFDPNRGYSSIMFNGEGNYVAALSGSTYAVWRVSDGKMVCNGELPETIDHLMINYDGSVLLVMSSNYLRAIDVKTNDMLWEKTAESNIVTEAYISSNGLYVSATGGISGIFDIKTGEVLYDGAGTRFSNDSTTVIANTYGSNPVLLATYELSTVSIVSETDEQLYEIKRYTDPSQSIQINLTHNCPEIYSTPPGNAGRISRFYTSEDTRYAAYTHYDGFIELFDVSDPGNVVETGWIAEHCFNSVTDLIFKDNLMASCGGYDPRCVLYDIAKGQIRFVLAGKEYCHYCEFSPDGSKILMLCGYGSNNVYVYSTVTGNLLYHFEAPVGNNFIDCGFNLSGSQVICAVSNGDYLIGEIYPTLDELLNEAEKR